MPDTKSTAEWKSITEMCLERGYRNYTKAVRFSIWWDKKMGGHGKVDKSEQVMDNNLKREIKRLTTVSVWEKGKEG